MLFKYMATVHNIPLVSTNGKTVAVTDTPAVRDLYMKLFKHLGDIDTSEWSVKSGLSEDQQVELVKTVIPDVYYGNALKIFKLADYTFGKISKTLVQMRKGYEKSGMAIQFDMNVRDYMDVIIIILFYKDFGIVSQSLLVTAGIEDKENALASCDRRLVKDGQVCESISGKRLALDSGKGYGMFLKHLVTLRPFNKKR